MNAIQTLYNIHMERKVPHFSKQFCKDIQKKTELEYFYWVGVFKDDLIHHPDSLKLEFIDSKRIEINQNLQESDYKIWFPERELETYLTVCLETFFRVDSMSQATGVKYNHSMAIGDYKYSSVTKKITIRPISKSSLIEANFNFGFLDFFKPLVQYLTWRKIMDELNEMAEEIRSKKNIHRKLILHDRVQPGESFMEGPGTENLHLNYSPKKFPQIFNEGAYDLFCYLDTEYTNNNKMLKAKYSQLFHFLTYEQLIICTQLEYIKFIANEKGETMSKILGPNFKYTHTILPLFSRLKSDFEKEQKRNKNEYFLNKN